MRGTGLELKMGTKPAPLAPCHAHSLARPTPSREKQMMLKGAMKPCLHVPISGQKNASVHIEKSLAAHFPLPSLNATAPVRNKPEGYCPKNFTTASVRVCTWSFP